MSLAVDGMGWKPVFFSEIEPFPCELLKQRFPGVPNLGDMTKIEGDKYNGTIDILAGGTPCQSFSVAGKRGGLEDGRGQLMLNFVRLAYETNARYVVWENVPGCLSSNGGEDFAALLSCLSGNDVSVPAKGWKNSGVVTNADGCYGVAWRVLDAQFTRVPGFPRAVPQRRRRVWLVGYIGDWRRAAEVLFVGEGLPWNFEAGEREGKEVAGGVEGGSGTASGKPYTASSFGGYAEGVGTVRAAGGDLGGGSETLFCMAHGQANAEIMVDKSPTITSRCGTGGGNLPLVKEAPISISDVIHGDKACNGKGWNDDGSAYTLDTMATQGVCLPSSMLDKEESEKGTTVNKGSLVRRLTVLECERLQGFPDFWTKISWRGKSPEDCPDAPRYKACGNSWAVNCARWVMMRIQQSEDKYKETL